jgi:hypothetical protein
MVGSKTTSFSCYRRIVASCHVTKHKHLFERLCGEHDFASVNLGTWFKKQYIELLCIMS